MTLQPESNRQQIQQRLNLVYIPVLVVFAVLAARLWQLQIIQGADFARKAEQNRIRTLQLVAPRGAITDRHGSPLVENRPSYNLLLYRESIEDSAATQSFIVEKLGVSAEDLASIMRRGKASPLYRPIVIMEDVGLKEISVVESHRRDHPEVQLGPEPRRKYRYGQLAAHALGYVGEVSEEELSKEPYASVRSGDLVGKSGIERYYNTWLKGKDGSRHVLVDSVGREMGLVDETPPVTGGELQLTLDLELQRVAEALLQGKVGVLLAMDPRNGEMLAMASSPSFDPNSFSTRISQSEWMLLLNDPNKPLQNRAIQGVYSPGSVFKVLMAEAGLAEGMIDESTIVHCTGGAYYYGRVFRCALRKGHGRVDLETAIARSCNIFFYDLGRRLGISKIAAHAQALGLGKRTGIDLPAERAGLMPSPEWKLQSRKSKWFPGETISVSIGQGAVSVTPLQILRAVSAISVGGTLTTPHVLLRGENVPVQDPDWPQQVIPVDPEATDRIRAGMWGSVNSWGTGHNAAVPGLDICGKTGTVQVLSREVKTELAVDGSEFEDHSWFAGFANRDNPEIAVVAFVEHGGKGGVAAAPMARELFRTYFGKKGRPELLTRSSVPAPAGAPGAPAQGGVQ